MISWFKVLLYQQQIALTLLTWFIKLLKDDGHQFANGVSQYKRNYLSRREISTRAYFRKAGYACGVTNKGHILIILGQFEDETSVNSMRT